MQENSSVLIDPPSIGLQTSRRKKNGLDLILAACVLLAAVAFALHASQLLYDGHYSVTRQGTSPEKIIHPLERAEDNTDRGLRVCGRV